MPSPSAAAESATIKKKSWWKKLKGPWRTPADRCCCCVPRCWDMRTGMFALGIAEVAVCSFLICLGLTYLILGEEAYVSWTQALLLLFNLYSASVGIMLILATHDEAKVLSYDERTMKLTILMYRMSVLKFLLDLCQSLVNLIFAILAIIDSHESKGSYLYLEPVPETANGAKTAAGSLYLIVAVVSPCLSGYLLWIKWSYKTKLYAEQKGGLLGLPVCQKPAPDRQNSIFFSYPVGRVVELAQEVTEKPNSSVAQAGDADVVPENGQSEPPLDNAV